ERVVVHGDHAEEVIVVLRDRLAGPVLVDVADGEVFEEASERPSLTHGCLLPRVYWSNGNESASGPSIARSSSVSDARPVAASAKWTSSMPRGRRSVPRMPRNT